MTVTIEAGAGLWWNYTLEKVGNAPPVTNDSPCGNNYCVLNDRQYTDNDRTYFFNLGDSFAEFPFDQTTYVLSPSRESGASEFAFEIEVGGVPRLIELGPEAFDQINPEDYEVLAEAFRNGSERHCD